MYKTILFALTLILFNTLNAKDQKASIKTSAVCKMCKKTIEQTLLNLDGVKSAKLDVTSKMVKVVFNDELVNIQKIESAISKVGYDANATKGDSTAYIALPKCCKKGAVCGH